MSQLISNVDVCTRLYLTSTHSVKQTNEDTDALISDLPTDTLKWIKKHRRLDCDAKIVLSHNRERQLRDIFNGIDVGKNGSIDLLELEEAVSFVKVRLEKKLGTFDGFNQIIKVFKSMDVNGDGKVDFREFTNAMTGSTKSALAKASEQEIANLHRCFLEFGVLKARRHAIAKINDYTGLSFTGENAFHLDQTEEAELKMLRRKSVRHPEGLVEVNDYRKYNLFRTLFEDQRDSSGGAHAKEMEDQIIAEDGKRLDAEELILKEFLEGNKNLLPADADLEREAEFDQLQSRLHEERRKTAEEFAKDPDALAQQALHEEGLKFFAERRRNQRPATAPSPHLRTVDGRKISSSLSPFCTNVLPAEPDARGDLTLRLQAKKEAYDVLRGIRYLRPVEQYRQQQHSPAQLSQLGALTIRIPGWEDPASEAHGSLLDSGSRSGSNLPTPTSRASQSRKHTATSRPARLNGPNGPKSAIRKSQSLDMLLSGGWDAAHTPGESRRHFGCGSRQPCTPPVTVRLTSHAAIFSSSPSSPVVSSRMPAYISTISRPSTANALSARQHVLSTSGPGTPHVRIRLRSPKKMVQPVYC